MPRSLARSVELVHRARAGDGGALDDLLRRYEDRILRIARIRMGRRVRSFMESRDLVQNTYLVATQRLGDFEPRSHAAIIHWLARILENQIRDAAAYANAAKRDPSRLRPLESPSEEHGDSPAHQPPDRGPLPSELVSQAELREIFDECVSRLPEDQREAILLRDYAELGWTEIARELHRPGPGAARQLHRRARLRLARHLGQRVDLEP